MRCTQTSMPNAPSKAETVGTTKLGFGTVDDAFAVVVRFGVTPGSEPGGDPRPAGLTFTNEPQLTVPGSAGGVMTGTRCSTWALAAGGVAAKGLMEPSSL